MSLPPPRPPRNPRFVSDHQIVKDQRSDSRRARNYTTGGAQTSQQLLKTLIRMTAARALTHWWTISSDTAPPRSRLTEKNEQKLRNLKSGVSFPKGRLTPSAQVVMPQNRVAHLDGYRTPATTPARSRRRSRHTPGQTIRRRCESLHARSDGASGTDTRPSS
jgi:hypothetical protein